MKNLKKRHEKVNAVRFTVAAVIFVAVLVLAVEIVSGTMLL